MAAGLIRVSILTGLLSAGLLPAQLVWNEWTDPSPPPRADVAVAYDIAREQTLLFGGQFGGTGFMDTFAWHQTSWRRLQPSTSPPARWEHAMVYDELRDRVVMFGGQDGVQPLSDTWEWNGTDWIQRFPATVPTPRRGHALVYDPHVGRVLMFGGSGPLGKLADTWEWSGLDWIRRSPVASPSARAFHSMGFYENSGTVVLFGGESSGCDDLGDTWEWDGVTWTERTPATSPVGRARAAMAFDVRRVRIVLFGGERDGVPRSDTWEWTGSTWSQSTPSVAPPARYGHGLCFDHAMQHAVLIGGTDGVEYVKSDTWVYGNAGWTVFPSGSPGLRTWHTLTHVPGVGVVCYGGQQADAGTWLFDGVRWTNLSPTPGSNGVKGHAAAFDSGRGAIVAFGGQPSGQPPSDETWEWQSGSWTERTPAVRPPARWLHGLAYDSRRGRTVLFGGTNANWSDLGDTWEWDGTTWNLMSSVHAPSARNSFAMVFDEVRGKVVLFGGAAAGTPLPSFFADTWEWDGTDWTEVATAAAPPPRGSFAGAYDAQRKRLVVFGGVDDHGLIFADTWEFDGATWREKAPIGMPGSRYLHAMAYDADRQLIVMTGGAQSGTWEYATASRAAISPFGVGCLGSRGIPTLEPSLTSMPQIGDRVTLVLDNLPLIPTPASIMLGTSDLTIGGVPLPLDLSILGMPGCLLYQNAEFAFGVPSVAGMAVWSFVLPEDPALLDRRFFTQGLVVDHNVPPLGVVTSNAVAAQIGA